MKIYETFIGAAFAAVRQFIVEYFDLLVQRTGKAFASNAIHHNYLASFINAKYRGNSCE